MVDINKESCGKNNKDAKLYTVNLSWEFDSGLSPVYDFSTINIGNFYSNSNKIYTGYNQVDYNKSIKALGHKMRYNIDITPIQSITSEKNPNGPYPYVNNNRFFRYLGKDVTEMNNDSFTFLYSDNI
jgi:hypothetical protein